MKRDKYWYEGKMNGWWTIIKFDHTKYKTTKYHKKQAINYYIIRCRCGYEKTQALNGFFSNKSLMCKSCSVRTRYKNSPNQKIGNKSQNWKGTNDIPRIAFTKIKARAEKCKKEFNITIDDLQELWDQQNGRCALSGRKLVFNNKSFSTQHSGKVFNFASLDRIDSKLGYIKENVQWVCVAANIAKQQYDMDQFLMLIKDIYKFQDL